MANQQHLSLDVLLDQQGRIRTLARSLVRDAAAADDLVQDALVAALRRPAVVEGDGRGWAARVLGNLARDRARSERRRAHREEAAAHGEVQPDVADAVIAAERQRELVDAVLALEEPYRGVVLLRWFEQLPPREIVRRTGRSPETVKKQLQRGLARLRERLEERFGKGGAWAVALLPLTGDGVVRAGALGALAAGAPRVLAVAALVGVAVVGGRALRPEPAPDLRAADPAALAPAASPASLQAAAPAVAGRAPAAPLAADEHAHGTHESVTEAPAPVAPRTFDPPFRARVVGVDGAPLGAQERGGLALRFVPDEAFDEGGFVSLTLTPDADGWVESDAAPERATAFGALELDSDRWAILALGRRDSTGGPLEVVVAPGARVAGTVVDGDALPLGEVEVALQADLRSLGSFPGEFFESGPMLRWSALTDSLGRFDLGRVPTDGRFTLEATGGLRGSRSLPVPATDREDLVVSLTAVSPALVQEYTVRVVDDAGLPLEDAEVLLGWRSGRTDARGDCVLELRQHEVKSFVRDGVRVLARVADGRFGVESFDVDGEAPHVVRIPADMLAVRGQLLDATGAPITGAVVHVLDGTQKGSSSARLEGPHTADVPGRRRTDSDGRFELGLMQDRPYTLRFIERRSMLVLDVPGVVPGGADLEVRIPEQHLFPLVEGRALDALGRPLAGLEVRLTAPEQAPGGGVTTWAMGDAKATDADGRFRFTDVPRRGVLLVFDPRPSDGFGGPRVALDDVAAPGPFDVTLDLDCDVSVTAPGQPAGAWLRFLAADGTSIAVKEVVAGGIAFRPLARRQEDGTFARLFVPQRAARVELLDADRARLALRDLDLSPLERTVLEL